MHYAFVDNRSLYIVMDYMNSGDLRFQMSARRYFDEKVISKSIIIRIHSCECHFGTGVCAFDGHPAS